MKITCPKCNASGTIPDHEIPEEGRFLTCPRCKHGFDVKKPRATTGDYSVDVCPSCAYSTFGDERFSTCPKCGVVVKAFIDRQREEMSRSRDMELLNRKYTRDDAPAQLPPNVPLPPSAAVASAPAAESKSLDINEMIENLHPVNMVGYGTAAAAVIILLMGAMGVLDYLSTDYMAKVSQESIELGIAERPTGFKIFIDHGLKSWLSVLYGGTLLAAAVFFLQRKAQARKALIWLLWGAVAYFPVMLIIRFVQWWLAPIPHTWGGYFVEMFNMLLMSALAIVPIFFLIRFLDDRRITSVVRQ